MLGADVGLAAGIPVGVTLGLAEAPEVGVAVCVGCLIKGRADGALLGGDEGKELGTWDGELVVGADVGVTVGPRVVGQVDVGFGAVGLTVVGAAVGVKSLIPTSVVELPCIARLNPETKSVKSLGVTNMDPAETWLETTKTRTVSRPPVT